MELTIRLDRNAMDCVEAFAKLRSLQFARCCRQGGHWNSFLPLSLIVAPDSVSKGRLKEVRDYFEAGFTRTGNIARTVRRERIRVIDRERSVLREALRKEQLFLRARSQHVQADAHMSFGKVPEIERGLSRGLHSNKNDGFHRQFTLW